MDEQQPFSGRRRGKFAPKAPPQKKPSTVVPKSEVTIGDDEDDAAQAQKLINKFNENLRRKVPKAEKKSSVQVAFGPGASSSTSIRKYGVPKSENTGSSSGLGINYSDDNDGKIVISSPTTAKEDGSIMCSTDSIDESAPKIKNDYVEPWDYHHTYYPTILPLRRPYSGDPELLNEAEFGEDAKNVEYDENAINPALDLGLVEDCHNERKMFLFQIPANLPHVKRSASAKGKEKAESSKLLESKSGPKKGGSLEQLPEGYMGKMLVYKSGAVKLKLGNILYDVNPGSDCIFAQDVMAINNAAKHCCSIGEIEKHAVVSVNPDSILDSVINLE